MIVYKKKGVCGLYAVQGLGDIGAMDNLEGIDFYEIRGFRF